MQKCTLAWACLLSGLAKEAQWSMCSLRQRGREGGWQAVPSSWVIFNQQYYHASQKDLQPSHPPKKKKKKEEATHTLSHNFSPSLNLLRHFTAVQKLNRDIIVCVFFVALFLSFSSILLNSPMVSWCCEQRRSWAIHALFKLISRK